MYRYKNTLSLHIFACESLWTFRKLRYIHTFFLRNQILPIYAIPAIATAISNDGSRLATLMVLGQTRLMPTQKIRILPTRERLFSTASVINPDSTAARAVMMPCRMATGRNEKTQPFPMEEAMISTMIKSRIALATRVE